jgi:hypothetical protein
MKEDEYLGMSAIYFGNKKCKYGEWICLGGDTNQLQDFSK